MNPHYARKTHISFNIRQDECDAKHRLTVSALIGYLQEAAWLASVESGYAIPELMEKYQITWLLSRFVLLLNRLPVFGEEVHIITYASKTDKFYTQRDFQVFVGNELVATSGSLWLLLNVQDKKLARPNDFSIDDLLYTENVPFELPQGKTETLKIPDYQYTTTVRWHDLDMNLHTNNRHYFRWALDALPAKWLNEKQLMSLDFHFRTESILGDTLMIQAQQNNQKFLHAIVHENGKEAIRGESVWGE